MLIKPIKTRIFREREDLLEFIYDHVKKIPEKSILVVTSKIVALSQGRTINVDPKIPKEKFKEKIIKKESDYALPKGNSWITVKDSMVLTSAGIDESNGNGKIILLPKNSFQTAQAFRRRLQAKFKVRNFGILIVDSRRIPFRSGIFGISLGYAGFGGIRDTRGQPDIFGRILKFARTNVSDSLATAAVLCMGEGNEQQPLALVTNAPVKFVKKIDPKELFVDPREDLYRPFFDRIGKLGKIKFKSWRR
jgi:dihydrofolate synthase / folylpolyglutamate synthase